MADTVHITVMVLIPFFVLCMSIIQSVDLIRQGRFVVGLGGLVIAGGALMFASYVINLFPEVARGQDIYS